jgi:hypothetical protein
MTPLADLNDPGALPISVRGSASNATGLSSERARWPKPVRLLGRDIRCLAMGQSRWLWRDRLLAIGKKRKIQLRKRQAMHNEMRIHGGEG